jgi:hypothetical protein
MRGPVRSRGVTLLSWTVPGGGPRTKRIGMCQLASFLVLVFAIIGTAECCRGEVCATIDECRAVVEELDRLAGTPSRCAKLGQEKDGVLQRALAAASSLEAMLADSAGAFDTHYMLGEIYLFLCNMDYQIESSRAAVVKHSKAAMRLQPDNPDPYGFLASFYQDAGEFSRAESLYVEALWRADDSARRRVLSALTITYLAEDKPLWAFGASRQLLKEKPGDDMLVSLNGFARSQLDPAVQDGIAIRYREADILYVNRDLVYGVAIPRGWSVLSEQRAPRGGHVSNEMLVLGLPDFDETTGDLTEGAVGIVASVVDDGRMEEVRANSLATLSERIGPMTPLEDGGLQFETADYRGIVRHRSEGNVFVMVTFTSSHGAYAASSAKFHELERGMTFGPQAKSLWETLTAP